MINSIIIRELSRFKYKNSHIIHYIYTFFYLFKLVYITDKDNGVVSTFLFLTKSLGFNHCYEIALGSVLVLDMEFFDANSNIIGFFEEFELPALPNIVTITKKFI